MRPFEAPDCRKTAFADSVRKVVCYHCGHECTYHNDGRPRVPPFGNCPVCSLCLLEFRYYTDDWRRRFTAASARADRAASDLAAAREELARLYRESKTSPHEEC